PFQKPEIDMEAKNGPMEVQTGEQGMFGKTTVPKNSANSTFSTNDNVQIYINDKLSDEGQAQTTSHELYGHALLYLRAPEAKNYGHQVQRTEKGFVETNKSLINEASSAIQE